ncbi:hypothetical protein MKX53_19635 [Psychrobacillus sp. FSL K6-4615]|uniref:hypothetical protein n=1 Tax=Psychrobacillus sp. FSL K6-4615 TaxID=2921551 RepID=UPI0030FA34D1
MNLVVVTDIGVDTYKKWSDVTKNHAIEKSEFVKYGDDYVAYMDEESHRVSKDIKLLEDVASREIFGKPKVDTTSILLNAIVVAIVMTLML